MPILGIIASSMENLVGYYSSIFATAQINSPYSSFTKSGTTGTIASHRYNTGFSTSNAGFVQFDTSTGVVTLAREFAYATGRTGATAAMVDSSGNIYVFADGVISNSPYYDVSLVKWNSSGTKQWERMEYRLSGVTANYRFSNIGRIVNDLPYIFIGNDQTSPNKFTMSLNKIDTSTGAVTSAVVITGRDQGGGNWESVNYISLSTDNSNWIISGILIYSTYTPFITKIPIDSTTPTWNISLTTPTGLITSVRTNMDSSGNVYCTGRTTSSNVFIAKINSSGTLQWSSCLTHPNGDSQMSAPTIDASGNIYFGGQIDGASGVNAYNYLVKYNSSGVLQWQRKITTSNPTNGSPFVRSIIVDGDSILVQMELNNQPSPNHNATSQIILKYPTSGVPDTKSILNSPTYSLEITPSNSVVTSLTLGQATQVPTYSSGTTTSNTSSFTFSTPTLTNNTATY
jgi:hypothetical protein